MQAAISPNGGSVKERRTLEDRFGSRVEVNNAFTRKTVSYQGNRHVPGLRWMKYKEGFSRTLVESLLREFRPKEVLDPFSGIGTTPLVAASRGLRATGIEIMPVGVRVGEGITEAANGLSRERLESIGAELLDRIRSDDVPSHEHRFPHVRITEAAFPSQTETAIANARGFIGEIEDASIQRMLNLACMTVLEDVSYTRKDGQYLRWDYRASRKLRSKVDKGPILTLEQAVGARLFQMVQDIDTLKQEYGGGYPNFQVGSSLELLRFLPSGGFDMVITSPPYANRYDYTRTYALELAWLGYDQDAFSELRQSMLTATVENRPKWEWLLNTYGQDSDSLSNALQMYEGQGAVHEILTILNERISELGNRHVVRLIEGYFFEMALIISELGRILRPGGTVIMVNDNVQYHGEEVPTDLILSDFAEQSGFVCEKIWVLPRGKGNSSQQMRRFGRREIRKCVYKWVRTND
jgi:DNA modification methylase